MWITNDVEVPDEIIEAQRIQPTLQNHNPQITTVTPSQTVKTPMETAKVGMMRGLAFLDANVLTKPFTRTILIVGTAVEGTAYLVGWSEHAEAEGNRHLRPQAKRLDVFRSERGLYIASNLASEVLTTRINATDFSSLRLVQCHDGITSRMAFCVNGRMIVIKI